MTAKVDLTPPFPPCFHPRLPYFSGDVTDVTDVTVKNKTTVYACAREEGEEGTFSLSQMSRTELARVTPWRENEG